MKKIWLIVCLWPWILLAKPRALVFIDSAGAAQASLVEGINEMLFYSPTFRSRLDVEIFDINSTSPVFAGSLHYTQDRGGYMVARYRPPVLPFLICINEQQETLRMQLEQKEQLCLCAQGC